MRIPLGSLFLLMCAAGLAFAADGSTQPSVLPNTFGGWQLTGPVQTSDNPAVADPTNGALLKEYGFTDMANASYARDDGRKLTVKAARFQDATGAYAAFTFYRTPDMQDEKIGDLGSSLNQRVLFFRGNILVEAIFQRFSAMSAAELRELAAGLPRPVGSSGSLPALPSYLPKQSYVNNSSKYIVGPVGLEKTGAPLSANYVDFSRGAEAVLGDYTISGAAGKLMVISYPTPQIAAAQLKLIDSAPQTGTTQILARRSGPLVVVWGGQTASGDAKSLLSSVNYDAEVTWNEKAPTRRDNAANLIVGVILLAAIVCGLSLVAGVVFGGFRVTVKKLWPGRVFDRPEQIEIIALNLSEPDAEPADSDVSSSIKAG